ncbi:MAG: hypothetical protein RL156_1760 [Bacteroidota bacterium]|jgi:hypothetical protein
MGWYELFEQGFEEGMKTGVAIGVLFGIALTCGIGLFYVMVIR